GRTADPVPQAVEGGGGGNVVGQHAGEDLDRGLKLLGDDDVRSEPAELGDLRHIAGARDDVDAGVEASPDAHHAASGRGVGDRDDEHSGTLCAEGAQNLFAGGIAVEGRLAARAGLVDGLRVELDDEIR